MFLFGIILISLEVSMTDVPAWMFCTELLNKIKVEMVNQALDVLDSEITRKSISISGSTVELPDRPNEVETKLFVLEKIVENADEMQERYTQQSVKIRSNSSPDANQLIAAERAEHLALSVEMIKQRMHSSKVAEAWIGDVSMHVLENSPSCILKITSDTPERLKLLHFVLENTTIRKEEVLTQYELDVISAAVNEGKIPQT